MTGIFIRKKCGIKTHNMLKVLNFEQAYEAHSEAESRNAALAREQMQKKQDLDTQIAALDEQIRGIYDAWGGQGKTGE